MELDEALEGIRFRGAETSEPAISNQQLPSLHRAARQILVILVVIFIFIFIREWHATPVVL